MSTLSARLAAYPGIAAIIDATLADSPDHLGYCEKRFAADTPDFLARTEEFAQLALKNMGDDLPRYVADYHWMCDEFLQDEFYFRREGKYRLSTFADAYREVYSNADYMSRYVRGILISQVLWDPHARAFDIFRTTFLASIKPGGAYLEVGPGHGFFLYFASQAAAIDRLEAWDVSPSSIAEARQALAHMGVTRDITIVEQDVLAAPARHDEFDAAVISEVLEHLERPDLALQSLHSALKPGGRVFINAPVNSPAPDHIYLWRSPDEFRGFVEAQGFIIDEAHDLPQTGVTLARALKYAISISCVVIARKPG
ncbi:MAG: class I SAM-dependent methyltransferase [Pseudomonadota bacterium]|nr:class I SAM-dependent methyltransferase [Pseudomonadota bacterium]